MYVVENRFKMQLLLSLKGPALRHDTPATKHHLRGLKKYYPGFVTKVHEETGKYDIKYHNGREQNASPENVKGRATIK